MLPKNTLHFVLQSLLAATTLAAPVEVPAALAPRQTACPVATRWERYLYTTTWLSTTTLTNRLSALGSVTSTKTESQTRTINTVETVYSPAVITYPSQPSSPHRLFVSHEGQLHQTELTHVTSSPQPSPSRPSWLRSQQPSLGLRRLRPSRPRGMRHRRSARSRRSRAGSQAPQAKR